MPLLPIVLMCSALAAGLMQTSKQSELIKKSNMIEEIANLEQHLLQTDALFDCEVADKHKELIDHTADAYQWHLDRCANQKSEIDCIFVKEFWREPLIKRLTEKRKIDYYRTISSSQDKWTMRGNDGSYHFHVFPPASVQKSIDSRWKRIQELDQLTENEAIATACHNPNFTTLQHHRAQHLKKKVQQYNQLFKKDPE